MESRAIPLSLTRQQLSEHSNTRGEREMEDDRSGTLDSMAQRKHAAMLERLSNLHQTRLHESAARRTAGDGASPAFESVSAFLDRFADARRSIEVALDRCRALAADPSSATQLKPELDKVSVAIADLDRLVAENSYFLPSYEVRSSLNAIAQLKEALENANAELLPRKKFSFKNKASKKDPSVLLKEITGIKLSDAERSNLSVLDLEMNSADVEKLNLGVRDSPGFRKMEGAVLVKRFKISEGGEGDFTLADLNSCKIYLQGRFRALFIHRLVNCQIFAGPVLGSVLIEDVNGCLFMLASHQIRIHQARATDFYLRVRSRPIIEDSSGVRFAPYRLFYKGIDDELKDSGLGEETGNWANVDDFKWLRAVHSPNWCLIPEEERVETMDVSDMGEQ